MYPSPPALAALARAVAAGWLRRRHPPLYTYTLRPRHTHVRRQVGPGTIESWHPANLIFWHLCNHPPGGLPSRTSTCCWPGWSRGSASGRREGGDGQALYSSHKTCAKLLGINSELILVYKICLLAGTPGVRGWARPTTPCSGPTGNSQYPSTTDSAICLLYLYLL